tara:strand:+ start:576 stop:788 length:213 start_codon:yes stop_codon:yes gene_type:complete
MKTDLLTLTNLRLVRAMEKDECLALTAQCASVCLEDLIDELKRLEWSEQHIIIALQAIAIGTFNRKENND